MFIKNLNKGILLHFIKTEGNIFKNGDIFFFLHKAKHPIKQSKCFYWWSNYHVNISGSLELTTGSVGILLRCSRGMLLVRTCSEPNDRKFPGQFLRENFTRILPFQFVPVVHVTIFVWSFLYNCLVKLR